MADIERGRRMVWRFLLSAMAACLGSGAALATCSTDPLPSGTVPCYIRVQPIDVANVQKIAGVETVFYNPFNPNSPPVQCPLTSGGVAAACPLEGSSTTPSSTAGQTFQPLSAANIPAMIPNNSTSSNPIGFVVQPASGATPGSLGPPLSPAVDVTRTLLNQVGIDLVWLPMTEYVYYNDNPNVSACPTNSTSCVQDKTADFTSLNVTLASTGNTVASCTGFISGTTLTITTTTTACQNLAAYDFLTGTVPKGPSIAINADGTPATYITLLGTGSGGKGTYTVTCQSDVPGTTIPGCTAGSQTVGSSKQTFTITATSSTLTSSQFKALSQQCKSGQPCPTTGVTGPTAISQGGTPVTPLGGGALKPTPFSPPDPTIVNMFFVNALNPPPAIGGNLFGLAWICNNGVAISSQTFSQGRPDTMAHELLHNLCLDHTTYGAGPWTAPGTNGYTAPSGTPSTGVVPVIPNTPLPGECDSNYTSCGANLMTTGINRTEPALPCILLDGTPVAGSPAAQSCTAASAGFFNPNALADRLSFPVSPSVSPPPATCIGTDCTPLSGTNTTQLPVSQQEQALEGLQQGQSSLLSPNSPPLGFSELLSPIPQETTKAQLGTDGSSAGRAIFDLSSPAGGKPGETLLGWVLTLPRGQSFSRHDGFHIVSQSREDLVQDVKYYPGPENTPLKRNIAYQRGGDNNANDPSIAAAELGPCALESAQCLVVKFQPPGLGAHDSISFSDSILSGDAPITNEDLCKAKITYVFSDGYVTTSNFGVCPPAAPLIANSWHPDPHVAPHFVPSDVLLATGGSSLGCTPVPGSNPAVCPDVDVTSISDADALQEAGAPQLSCDNGATMKGSAANPVTGMISGANIIITAGQTCHYQDCEFAKNLTINNATAYLQNCTVAGNLTMNSGKLYTLPLDPQSTAPSVDILGNLTIGNPDSLPNSFSIGPGTTVKGTGVVVQNVPSGGLGYICGLTASGNVNVNNNMSPIQIGNNTQEHNCVGTNFITGHLNCKGNNPNPTGGGNTVQNGASGQCATPNFP